MAATLNSSGEVKRAIAPDKENLVKKFSSVGTPGRHPLKSVQENGTPTEPRLVKKRHSSMTPSGPVNRTRKNPKRLSIPVHIFRRSLKPESRKSTGFVIAEDKTIEESTAEEDASEADRSKKEGRVQEVAIKGEEESEKELDSFSKRVVTQVLTDVVRCEAEKGYQAKLKEFTDIILQMNKERLQMEQKLSHLSLSAPMPESQKPKSSGKSHDTKQHNVLERELSKKKSEIRQLRSELFQLQGDKKFKYLEQEIEGKKVEIKQLKLEINQLQHKLKEIPALKTDLQKAKEQNKTLNDIVVNCRKENNSQKAAVTKLQKELTTKDSRIRHHIEENEKQIDQLKKEVKEKELVIQELRKAVWVREEESKQCDQQCGEVDRLVSRLEILTTMAETFKASAEVKVQQLTDSLEKQTNSVATLEQSLKLSQSQSLQYQQECEKLSHHLTGLNSQVDIGKLEISRQRGVIEEMERALEKNRQELCLYQDHLELVQCQQQETNAFILDEKRNLEEAAREYEHELKAANEKRSILDMSLREKSVRCDELEEAVKLSRSLYREKQDELDATQYQAHFIMLQQQAEMTEAAEELNEAWDILESLLDRFRQEAQLERRISQDSCHVQKTAIGVPMTIFGQCIDVLNNKENTQPSTLEDSSHSPQPLQSLVQSVLDAVAKSSDEPPEGGAEESQDDVTVPSLKQQVSDLKQGLVRLAEIGSGEAANQEAQEKIAELQQARNEMEKDLNSRLNQFVSDLEISRASAVSLQSEVQRKSAEIERLVRALQSAHERLNASERAMSRKLDQQEQLQLLREKLERSSTAYRKLDSEKQCIANQLTDTLARVDQLSEVSEGTEEAHDMPSKLLREKHEAELKLREFKEKFVEYRMRTDDQMNEFKFRTNSNISVLQRNLQKAESEICRLDDIMEKIRLILHKQSTVVSGCPELTKLLRFLDGDEGSDR